MTVLGLTHSRIVQTSIAAKPLNLYSPKAIVVIQEELKDRFQRYDA